VRQVSQRDASLLDTEDLADELSPVVIALDQQVGGLLHCDVHFFALVLLVTLHHDEQFVLDAHVAL
jgi:hypothetical protein